MQVIRCEHPEGMRAFKAMYYELGWGDWNHLPNPYCDLEETGAVGGDWFMTPEHVCAAFPHTLDDWFPLELRESMRSLGFRFVVLDLPEGSALLGRYQAVFDRSVAVEVEEYLQ